MADFSAERPCRILSLDGGGAKGFYTLGVLREIEGMLKCPLHEKFDLIFGTSSGAIIAALLALGKSVKEISDLYEKHVPTVMQKKNRAEKSAALKKLGDDVFKDAKFDQMKTGVGIVTTRWVSQTTSLTKTGAQHQTWPS
jgi:patatin-like phospholipase/acyl hydrolase